MGGPFFLLFGIVSRWLQSMEEDHFSKQCVKLRNWIPLFLGCFFGDRVVCKKKKGNGHSGKKKISRESLTMSRKKRVFCMYIYRFVGYLLTGITIYNPLIYELSSKENLLDSLQFFFPFSPITWTRSIVGTKLYPPYFSKIESNDFFTRVSTKEKLAKSIEDDSFRGIILAKSLETPNLEIGPSPSNKTKKKDASKCQGSSPFARPFVARISRNGFTIVQLSLRKGLRTLDKAISRPSCNTIRGLLSSPFLPPSGYLLSRIRVARINCRTNTRHAPLA